ncbi:MerR family transcriptional regulator [Streptomonospora algeriensis]|uniref:MerR family transcriptional regulator n=1 Tax=Streptomonospora algeriensis TaxID=995084 RepID=A0ABW3BCF2_9ACTN
MSSWTATTGSSRSARLAISRYLQLESEGMIEGMTMQIGELAKHIGVSTRSLRYYEKQGLLSPYRNEKGYRVYDQLAIVRAGNIKNLLQAGLTTEDVLHYIDNGCLDRPLAESPRCSAELDTVRERLAGLDERIVRLQRLRDRLASHESDLEKTLVASREVQHGDSPGKGPSPVRPSLPSCAPRGS